MKIPEWAPWAAVAAAVGLYFWNESLTKGTAPGPSPSPTPRGFGFVPGGCGGRPGGCPPEGAPPGYHIYGGRSPEVIAYAKGLLVEPLGSWHHFFDTGGTSYVGHLECHFHPCDGPIGPHGWHKGATIYQENAV